MAVRAIVVGIGLEGSGALDKALRIARQSLSLAFGFETHEARVRLEERFINALRMQVHAPSLNMFLREIFQDYDIVVGVCDHDGYVEGLNFVFGLALPGYGVATVFIARLLCSNTEKFVERVTKEVLHEVGHLLGLEHCSNRRCVMSFSNSIIDVDAKSYKFCSRCAEKVRRLGIEVNPLFVLT